jgi:hypothetical protein
MLSCPRDRHNLVRLTEDKSKQWGCNVCEGRFTQTYASPPRKARGASFPRDHWDPKIGCPKHKKTPMRAFRHRGVTLDYCGKCGGVWLDGDDVRKVFGLKEGADSTRHGAADSSWASGAVDGFIGEALTGLVEGVIGALLSPG